MKINVKGAIISDEIAWIYDYFGIPYCSPKKIHDKINEAKGEKIDVYINSGGGEVFAGSEIYSALREYKGEVKIHVVGVAASAASVIACAAKSDISPTGTIMIHNTSLEAAGDYHAMDKASDILKKMNETVANAYVAKTGMTMSAVLDMMDKETWLSANDAVQKGLIDEIAENKNMTLVASIGNGMLPMAVIEKMMSQKINEQEKEKKLLQKAEAKLKLLKMKGGV